MRLSVTVVSLSVLLAVGCSSGDGSSGAGPKRRRTSKLRGTKPN